MPETYVVHLGNSKELTEIAEDGVAKRVLREHVRQSLGVRNDDILFAIINSMFSFVMFSTRTHLICQHDSLHLCSCVRSSACSDWHHLTFMIYLLLLRGGIGR